MGREKTRKSKSRHRNRSRERYESGYVIVLGFIFTLIRWGIPSDYGQVLQVHPDVLPYHYDGYSADAYMVPLPFGTSSASHGLVPSQTRSRSTTRMPHLSDEHLLVDAPFAGSSQSMGNPSDISFVDAFLGSTTEPQMTSAVSPFVEPAAQFGLVPQYTAPMDTAETDPHVVPVVTRKKPSGFFKALEKFTINTIPFNFGEMVDAGINDSSHLSTMWSGILTGSKFDRNYQVILMLIERVFTALLDDTVRRLRDDAQAQQIAVFLRQIWTALLPVCAETVEKWIVNYHKENNASFFKDLDTDEWDEDDEAREKRLDELDQEIEELQAEIEAWERIQRNYPGIDPKATQFVQSKLLFAQRLNLFLSVPAESTSSFLEGGLMGPFSLPVWEHPQLRVKHKIRDVMMSAVSYEMSTLGSYQRLSEQSAGIPAHGYCFEPSVVLDSRWETAVPSGWVVDLPPDENYAAMNNKQSSSHRLSLDALSAFN